MRRFALLVPVVLFAPAALAAAQNATISGVVVSAVDGAPVVGATVTYRRLPKYLLLPAGGAMLASGEAAYATSAVTDSHGDHSSPPLPPGDYEVCVSTPGQPFLDPCLWGPPPAVSVGAGANARADLNLVLGVRLDVRVQGPQWLLPTSSSGPLDFPHLTVGVYFGSGAFLAAERTSVSAGLQDYTMAIPAGQPLVLWLQSRYITLSGPSGSLGSLLGQRIPFQATPGQDQAFTFSVTGAVLGAK